MTTATRRRSLAVALVATLGAACSRAGSSNQAGAPPLTYGAAMADVGRRFEVFGRAVAAGRFELADYQLGELDEAFDEVLPHAAPPREGHPDALPPLARTYAQVTLVDLHRAVATRERGQLTAAFARAADACNACHQASGHGFIVVPSVPGRVVPDTDPLPGVMP